MMYTYNVQRGEDSWVMMNVGSRCAVSTQFESLVVRRRGVSGVMQIDCGPITEDAKGCLTTWHVDPPSAVVHIDGVGDMDVDVEVWWDKATNHLIAKAISPVRIFGRVTAWDLVVRHIFGAVARDTKPDVPLPRPPTSPLPI